MNRAIRSAVVATAIGSMIACGGSPVEPDPPANIAGSYDMTVTASSTCSATLPADAREFKSIADITQTAATFKATLVGHVIFVSVTVSGSVSGQTVSFSTFALNELSTGGGVVLSTTGTASVAADGSMTGTLSGTYQSSASGAICNATNHQIKLVKKEAVPKVRRYSVLLVSALAIACGGGSTPTGPAPNSVTTTSFGVFTSGNVQLSYRLDVPAHTAPVGAVVFGHGSGMATKDSCRVFGLADGFVARGYATLCFDKRGVGQSTGQYIPVFIQNSVPILEELASDVAAGVAFMRSRPEIDPNRIGISGVSQAGWVVPIAAAKTKPAFMLLIVGPTVSYGLETFYSSIVEGTNVPVEEGYKALPSYTGPHGFDPKPVLESLNVPGLWLLGGEDRSIPTPATVAILDELIASGKPYSHVVFPGIGHNLPPNWPEIEKWLAKIGQ